MRTVVSYDDIATPQNNAPTQLGPPLPSTATQPPAKKRRTAAHHQKAQAPHRQIQHWDDPGTNAAVMNYGGQEPEGSGMDYAQEQEEEEEESRDLTHDEIWDDSALIDAWNSATAEYEAYHGKSKKWKEEPIKKSPLWYNVPPKEKKTNGAAPATQVDDTPAAQDSAPHDVSTFVPSHDPSLSGPLHVQPETGHYDQYLAGPTSGAACAGQDEAFSRALSATYWAGYWTAVYHLRRNQRTEGATDADAAEEDGEVEEGEEEGGEDMADLISTQR